MVITPESASFTFHHPLLGQLTGVIERNLKDVVQFLAVPYATHVERFRLSELLETLDGTSRNFTKPGDACPHKFSMSDIHSGGIYPGEERIQTSEQNSLILQINVPVSTLHALSAGVNNSSPSQLLPVMTYIHGGGFQVGKIDAVHNTAPFVQHSIALSQPVITTAMQYRLGALGFLPTPDGGKNLALYDQQNAFLWIQKFIEGFGGDPRRVTAFGESAGGFSICCHMLAKVPETGPLFTQAVLMSGVVGAGWAPITPEEGEELFVWVCEYFRISETGEDAVRKLRSLSTKQMVEVSEAWGGQGGPWRPVEDPAFFNHGMTWDQIPELLAKCEWISDLIVGNTAFEGAVFASLADSITPTLLLDHLKLELSEEAAQRILNAYRISPDMDHNLFLTPTMRFIGDVYFDAPTHALCTYLSHSSTKNIYRYVFALPNPFPLAPFQNTPHHWVDVYYLFRTLQFRYPSLHLRGLSDRHTELWIDFANGKAPWTAFKGIGQGEEVIMIADEREGWVQKTPADLGKWDRFSGINLETIDVLLNAWSEKKGHAFKPLDIAKLKAVDRREDTRN